MQRKDFARLEKTNKRTRPAGEPRLASVLRENGELRKTLAKMDVILECLDSGLAVIQGGKVKDITRKGLDMLGYSRDEIQGMDFMHLVDPSHRSFLTEMYERRLKGDSSPEPQEIPLVTKGGEAIPCDLVLHRMTHQGRAAFLAEIAPSGPRRERERNLIAERRDEIIAKMSSGLLRRMAPYVQALNDYAARLKTLPRLPGRSTAADPGLLSVLHELTSLTRRLETLSSEELDRSRVVPFDLGKVVQDVISHVKRDLSLAGRQIAPINLHCYLRQASPVEGDPVEIGNAVAGLLTNAMEAMAEGGDLYITAEENAGYSCVYIQESGTSIPEDLLPKIADPFFTGRGHGSDGLDLCMARAALKRHNGDLHLEGSRGQGTTITLRIPLSRKSERNGRPCVKKRKNMWILIVEEDYLIRELFFQVLSNKGYNVETAEALPECLERFKVRPFDLVIAGTVTGDSQALVRKIRKAAPQVCLALIGELVNEDASGALPDGSVDLVIGKPIDMNLTLNRISELLSGRAK
jgi:PAS domain S-box-containing protein